MTPVVVTRRVRRIERRFREARMMAGAFKDPRRPVVAHLVPTRRCNLSCTYCNEYDDHSKPVPTASMIRRVDALAVLGTGIVTMSGGEPLLHSGLEEIVRHVRRRGMIATVISNGHPLTRERITRLNRAGLDHLEVSIDNLSPDEISRKSLAILDEKLRQLAEQAEFDVTVNSAVGGGIRDPLDALAIARRAGALGFSATVGIIHDRSGQLVPLDERQRQVVEEIGLLGRSPFDFARHSRFQRNLSRGLPNDWRCRAGSRYLYVCEDGLVHWCSQQRGHPAVPLERYGPDDLEREYQTPKPCAPFCTIGCVHRVSQLDELREQPEDTLREWFGSAPGGGRGPARLPLSVRLLLRAFVTGRQRTFFRNAAQRLFGMK